jgi:hypothetical protein
MAGLDAKPFLDRATRPNGSLNYSKFEEMALTAYALALPSDETEE